MVNFNSAPGVALVESTATAQAASHPYRRKGAAVALLGASVALNSGCAPGSNNGDEGVFNASTTYYEYSGQQEGASFTFYGCGPGGGVISSLGDIEQTTAKQLKEASIGQGGKCVLTIPAGEYTAVQGNIYAYKSGTMTELFACDDHTKGVRPVDAQPDNQPYVEQSLPLTYAQLQRDTIDMQDAHGVIDALETLFAKDFGITTPFYNTETKQNNVANLSVTYTVSKSDAEDPQEGKNVTLASNLIGAVDTPFRLGNALAVPSEVPLGKGEDGPFYVTAFFAPKTPAATPEQKPVACATEHIMSLGQSASGIGALVVTHTAARLDLPGFVEIQ